MSVSEAHASAQRTGAEGADIDDDDDDDDIAVPPAWRSKRFRICVIAAAVVLAAGAGFGAGRAMGLGDNVVLSAIPRPATTATPFIEDDDGIGGDNQVNILSSTAPGLVHVLSGGVSVGAYDFTKDVLRELGMDLKLWRIRMRPGAPLGFGMLGDMAWLGLPGNPVSTMVTFELLVRPAIDLLNGAEARPLPLR